MTAAKGALQSMIDAMDASTSTFELDLSGLTVLTEAASGPFVVTPLLAAHAGATRVWAITADSAYASAAEVIAETTGLARVLGLADRIEVIARSDLADLTGISEVDIVTNLGFVRPINRELLARVGDNAVVSLMCEPWELRPRDVDVEACRDAGVAVLGTNEDDPRLRMFRYLPEIVVGLLQELGVTPGGASLALVSGGKFGAAIDSGLTARHARVSRFEPPASGSDGLEKARPEVNERKAASANAASTAAEADGLEAALAEADALVVADYPGSGTIFGAHQQALLAAAAAANPSLKVVHVGGDLRQDHVVGAGLRFAPERFAPVGSMSVTAGYLGVGPVIELHAAGLKVGEQLVRARRQGLTGSIAEAKVLETLSLALGFDTPTRRSV